MAKNTYQTDAYLDILFEHRNKQYGAYILRKFYPQHLLKAIFYTFSLVIFLFISFSFAKKNERTISARGEDTPSLQNPTEKPKEKPTPEQPKQKPLTPKGEDARSGRKNVFSSDFKFVDPDKFTSFNDEAANNPNGNDNATNFIQGPIGNPDGDIPLEKKDTLTEAEPFKTPTTPTEELPSYEALYKGGSAALGAYLQDMLGDEIIDGDALEFKVTFTVNTNNKVTDVFIEGDIDNAVKAKAKRVFEKMKDWQAAVQSGNAISTTRTMNIKIIVNE